MTTITVLIPAHNAERQLLRTIESIQAQTRPADRILVAADNCSDGTAAVARAAGVDVVEVSGGSKAACQNAALPTITTDLVLPVDDDTVLSADYLELLVPVFDDPQVAVAAGCVLTLKTDHWASKARMLEYLQSFHLFRPIQALSDSVVVCAGCCSVFRVEDIIAAGGFPDGFMTPATRYDVLTSWIPGRGKRLKLGEDQWVPQLTEDIYYTLSKHCEGRKAIYVHNAVAYAEEPDTAKFLRTQLRRWKSGHASALGRRLPGLIRHKPMVALWVLLQAAEILVIVPFIALMILLNGLSANMLMIGVLSDFLVLYIPVAIGCRKRGYNFIRALTWYPSWWCMKVFNLHADLRYWVPEFLRLRKPFGTYELGH